MAAVACWDSAMAAAAALSNGNIKDTKCLPGSHQLPALVVARLVMLCSGWDPAFRQMHSWWLRAAASLLQQQQACHAWVAGMCVCTVMSGFVDVCVQARQDSACRVHGCFMPLLLQLLSAAAVTVVGRLRHIICRLQCSGIISMSLDGTGQCFCVLVRCAAVCWQQLFVHTH
jgi:hypothetical protein